MAIFEFKLFLIFIIFLNFRAMWWPCTKIAKKRVSVVCCQGRNVWTKTHWSMWHKLYHLKIKTIFILNIMFLQVVPLGRRTNTVRATCTQRQSRWPNVPQPVDFAHPPADVERDRKYLNFNWRKWKWEIWFDKLINWWI
jgi:hypothetical protein